MTDKKKRVRGPVEIAHGRQMLVSATVGIGAGVGAIVFYVMLQFVTGIVQCKVIGYAAPEALGEPPLFAFAMTRFHPWLLIVMPALGALLSGLIVARYAPEAAGHGTDAAIRAYHWFGGKVRTSVPPVKAISAALTIGSGGSGGREGPIAQIGAGIGYVLARRLGLSEKETRIAMASGMAAGVGAIFRAPLAGALFGGEIMYRSADLEPELLLPCIVASISGYSVFSAVMGSEPLFRVPADLAFSSPLELIPYTILGFVAAAIGILYVRVFYAVHHRCQKITAIPLWAVAALGGLATGIVAYFRPGAAFTGYGGVQQALLGHLSAMHLLQLALLRIVTTTCSIGSGGSGGVFGPSIVLGGCLGGAVGMACHQLWPGLVPDPAAFVLVGMAGLFGGIAHAPISTIIMVSEMTGSYRLLVPSMWVCAIAFVLTRGVSLYTEQVAHRGMSGAHSGEHARVFLEDQLVTNFLVVDHPAVGAAPPPEAPCLDMAATLLDAAALFGPDLVERIFVVNLADGKVTGVLTRHAFIAAHLRAIGAA